MDSFCSGCGENVEEANIFECKCKRKFHKTCLDDRYSSLKLYNYDSFHCFFCKKNNSKNVYKVYDF